MIGVLVLTHGDLGRQFLETARLIGLDSENCVMTLSIDPSVSPEVLRTRVANAVKEVNRGAGVLILTDLFGGTPTNLSLSFLEEGKVEVVTGVNLPMIIKAVNHRNQCELGRLAEMVAESGKENIFRAGQILRKRLAKGNHGEKKTTRG
ncbi:MAG: PTS sugar transporter subunit IIA [Thermodesulfobacteriota bacterium]